MGVIHEKLPPLLPNSFKCPYGSATCRSFDQQREVAVNRSFINKEKNRRNDINILFLSRVIKKQADLELNAFSLSSISEYDGYDDVYGHSVDDDNCISPSDASQWIYDRAKGQQSMSAFMANNENIEEEDEDEGCENGESSYNKKRRDSENFQMPVLDDLTQAKLMSCMEEIRNVVGDTTSDRQIVETVMKYDYDVAKALDSILNAPSNSVREKRTPRPAKDQLEKGE